METQAWISYLILKERTYARKPCGDQIRLLTLSRPLLTERERVFWKEEMVCRLHSHPEMPVYTNGSASLSKGHHDCKFSHLLSPTARVDMISRTHIWEQQRKISNCYLSLTSWKAPSNLPCHSVWALTKEQMKQLWFYSFFSYNDLQ